MMQCRAACLWHNGDSLGVDGGQVGVLEDANLQADVKGHNFAPELNARLMICLVRHSIVSINQRDVLTR